VEGAKAAEAAAQVAGFIPVTWNGGGKKCKMVNWKPLEGREVYIWPDDDHKVYGDKHELAGNEMPWNEQPGMVTAFMVQKKLPQAKIIPFLEIAREVKADGADIVEALQVMTPAEIAEYIINTVPIKPPAPPANPIDTPREVPEPDGFPFRVLGVADDGKGYFLDRHERLTSFALSGITQNKLLTLATLTWWQQEFATGKGGIMMRDDWTAAIDAVIQVAGQVDFNPDRIRGRGAWRERDGRLCYHDGLDTRGEPSDERLYLRMTRKDIGLDSTPPDLSSLTAILNVTGKLSFETRADMIRCLAWSTLAPFAGALPWRPAGLLTGRSESGKSTIVDMLIKPLSQPHVFSGGESTEAGVRQTIKNDACSIVIEEAETDTPKKRQRRDDILSLMRQSTSDETPKAAKGTIDGKGMMFTLRSMFMFVAISPEVESIADDNRLFRINLEKNENDWPALKKSLGELLTPDICTSVRALTWTRLNDIFAMADEMSPVIQKVSNKSARFALSEAILFAAYQMIWKQAQLSDDDMHEFFEQIYAWQPPEESRDETGELIDRLLDETVQEGKDRYTLRQVLQSIGNGQGDPNLFKGVAGRYGLGLTTDGDLAIAKNFHAIYKGRSVSLAGKVRNCVIIGKQILTEEGDEVF
jgi:putative DNA primase/helicase